MDGIAHPDLGKLKRTPFSGAKGDSVIQIGQPGFSNRDLPFNSSSTRELVDNVLVFPGSRPLFGTSDTANRFLRGPIGPLSDAALRETSIDSLGIEDADRKRALSLKPQTADDFFEAGEKSDGEGLIGLGMFEDQPYGQDPVLLNGGWGRQPTHRHAKRDKDNRQSGESESERPSGESNVENGRSRVAGDAAERTAGEAENVGAGALERAGGAAAERTVAMGAVSEGGGLMGGEFLTGAGRMVAANGEVDVGIAAAGAVVGTAADFGLNSYKERGDNRAALKDTGNDLVKLAKFVGTAIKNIAMDKFDQVKAAYSNIWTAPDFGSKAYRFADFFTAGSLTRIKNVGVAVNEAIHGQPEKLKAVADGIADTLTFGGWSMGQSVANQTIWAWNNRDAIEHIVDPSARLLGSAVSNQKLAHELGHAILNSAIAMKDEGGDAAIRSLVRDSSAIRAAADPTTRAATSKLMEALISPPNPVNIMAPQPSGGRRPDNDNFVLTGNDNSPVRHDLSQGPMPLRAVNG